MTDTSTDSPEFLVFERGPLEDLRVTVVKKRRNKWITFRTWVKNSDGKWEPINSISLQNHEVIEVGRTLQSQSKRSSRKKETV